MSALGGGEIPISWPLILGGLTVTLFIATVIIGLTARHDLRLQTSNPGMLISRDPQYDPTSWVDYSQEEFMTRSLESA